MCARRVKKRPATYPPQKYLPCLMCGETFLTDVHHRTCPLCKPGRESALRSGEFYLGYDSRPAPRDSSRSDDD